MSLESTVGIAKIGTKSLRATVPEGIVAFLDVKDGDKLQWKMDMQNNERVALVVKKKLLNEDTKKMVSKYVRPERLKRK